MPIRSGDRAPYAPPATVMLVIDGFRDRGLTTPFTTEVLSRAGVTESLAPRTLASLEQLDLIDGDGNPTDALEGLRRAATDDYQGLLAEVIRGAYAEVFQFTDPSQDDRSRVEDAFRAYGPAGQRKRMVVTFLGLCQVAGIISEDAAPTTRGPYKPRKKSGGTPRKEPPRAATAAPVSPTIDSLGVPAPIQGLIASLPADGWTQAERAKFMAAFEVVLDYSVPLRTEGERPQTESVDAEV